MAMSIHKGAPHFIWLYCDNKDAVHITNKLKPNNNNSNITISKKEEQCVQRTRGKVQCDLEPGHSPQLSQQNRHVSTSWLATAPLPQVTTSTANSRIRTEIDMFFVDSTKQGTIYQHNRTNNKIRQRTRVHTPTHPEWMNEWMNVPKTHTIWRHTIVVTQYTTTKITQRTNSTSDRKVRGQQCKGHDPICHCVHPHMNKLGEENEQVQPNSTVHQHYIHQKEHKHRERERED